MDKKTKKHDFKLLYAYGRPFAPFYSFLMGMRAALYQREVFRVHRLPVPVISVGNRTMGGTGKTPLVIFLARFLSAGHKPAVVSRGYGGQAGGRVNIVSDGRKILLRPPAAADEAALIAESVAVPVLTGSDRAAVARQAVERFGADLVILDDGFQHMALHRDINLVLFKEATFLGNNRVFPGGDMREPLKALERADAFIITAVSDWNRAGAFKGALNKRFPGTPVYCSEYVPVGLVDKQGRKTSLTEAKNMKFWGFCGLAHPDSFRRTVEARDLAVAGFTAFKDHQPYSQRKLGRLIARAGQAGAHSLLTTEKDLVKIRELNCPMPVMALEMEVRTADEFPAFIRAGLENRER